MKIRVMIVDDHQIVNDGIFSMLKDNESIEVVDRCSNGREAIEHAQYIYPDIILMDISMPEIDGIEATMQIKERFPEIQILILSMYAEDRYVANAIIAGASGYLLKTIKKDELIKHIVTVHNGGGALDNNVTKSLIKTLRDKHYNESLLSERECQIVKLVCEGKTNSQIAGELFLSIQTIKAHLKRIFEKLEVNDRAHAVAVAMRKNIIS